MSLARRGRPDAGFTLIELLVVILVIGLLCAIALPVFLGQRAKGQDADAKSNVRSMATQMEACYTEVERYDSCPDPDTGIPLGTDPGEVEVSTDGDTYVLVGHAASGNTFTATKEADATLTLTCDDSAGNPRGGCVGGEW
jgi:type IV pilus assembly protein PilA